MHYFQELEIYYTDIIEKKDNHSLKITLGDNELGIMIHVCMIINSFKID